MMRALVAHHVDDAKPDFAIEATADGFKDYVKAYFSGTVATALAFIAMQRNGYVWAGHFEYLRPPTAKSKQPDFVFASPVAGTCLVESKGTRNSTSAVFDGTVEKDFLLQVERHLGSTLLGGAVASHGHCVGTWMTSVSGAELLVHHSEGSLAGGGRRPGGARGTFGEDEGPGIEAVQRLDMATAFTLAFGEDYGVAVRGGAIDALPPLTMVSWIGRDWIASPDALASFVIERPADAVDGYRVVRALFHEHAFAVERKTMVAALGRYWQGGDNAARGRPLPAFGEAVQRLAREGGGAMLSDGVAVLPRATLLPTARVAWRAQRGDFETA